MLRGGYKRRAYREWHRNYKKEKTKKLEEFIMIFSFVYGELTNSKAKAIFLNELKGYSDSFDYTSDEADFKHTVKIFSDILSASNNIGAIG